LVERKAPKKEVRKNPNLITSFNGFREEKIMLIFGYKKQDNYCLTVQIFIRYFDGFVVRLRATNIRDSQSRALN